MRRGDARAGAPARFYRPIDVGNDGFIWVLHPARAVLFREPSPADPMGESAQRQSAACAPERRAASGFLRARLEPAGPDYLSAYRRPRRSRLCWSRCRLPKRESSPTWWLGASVSAASWPAFGILLLLRLAA